MENYFKDLVSKLPKPYVKVIYSEGTLMNIALKNKDAVKAKRLIEDSGLFILGENYRKNSTSLLVSIAPF